jgi:NADPH2:quinone reductase
MKAVYYERRGPAREVLMAGERPMPAPAKGEVLVRVAASGINPSDVKTRAGNMGPMPAPLVIPHCDGAGTIEAVGDGVSSDRVGERVWLYNVNRTPDGFGQGTVGTAAAYVALPSAQAVHLPDKASFVEGACLGVPAMTAHRACFVAGSLRGKTVLVTGGAGGVGFYCVQMAKLDGARVIATVSSAEKAALARDGGADVTIDYKREDVVKRIREATGGAGVDHVAEVDFGANLPVTLEVLKPHGVIAAYASAGVTQPAFDYPRFMRKEASLFGVYVYVMSDAAKAAAAHDINHWIGAGQLGHAIAARFPIERVIEAHETVEAGRQLGNVVVEIG